MSASRSTNESVRVMVRFRPTNKSEQKLAEKEEPWSSLQETDGGINICEHHLAMHNIEDHGANNICFKNKKEEFDFDAVMDEKTTQTEAFEQIAQQICDEILQGYNGTIFVYGQSGSGKTHTMYGPEDHKDDTNIEKSMGIIPRSCAYIFGILDSQDPVHPLVQDMLSYDVRVEFLEIYGRELKDLSNLSNKPKIREYCINAHKDEWRVVIENTQQQKVANLTQVLEKIRFACSNRTVARTNLNATSSRSHMVMRLFVKIVTKDGEREGVANFSDLAGSEKVKKTGAVGQQLEEAKNILSSLSTLSRVIDALVKRKLPPFKESPLTFMLKDSLGGNCKTALLIACSPHVFNRDETVRSLRFGRQCRRVQNKAKINKRRSKAQLVKENEALKAKIAALQKSAVKEVISEEQQLAVQQKYQEYEQRIVELEATNSRQSEQLTQHACDLDELEKYRDEHQEFVEIKEQHGNCDSTICDLRAQITQLEQSTQLLSKQKLRAEEREKEFETQAQEKWKLQEADSRMRDTIEGLQANAKQRNKQLEEMEDTLQKAAMQVKTLSSKVHILEADRKTLQNAVTEQTAKRQESELEAERLDGELEETMDKVKRQDAAMREMQRKHQEERFALLDKTEQLEGKSQEISVQREEHEIIKSQLMQLQSYYGDVVRQQVIADRKLAEKLSRGADLSMVTPGGPDDSVDDSKLSQDAYVTADQFQAEGDAMYDSDDLYERMQNAHTKGATRRWTQQQLMDLKERQKMEEKNRNISLTHQDEDDGPLIMDEEYSDTENLD